MRCPQVISGLGKLALEVLEIGAEFLIIGLQLGGAAFCRLCVCFGLALGFLGGFQVSLDSHAEKDPCSSGEDIQD